MPSPTTRARVASALALAAATTSIAASPSSAAAVDPTELSAATDAALAARAALAEAAGSADEAKQAVTEADTPARTARSARAAARARPTHVSDRVADVTAQEEFTASLGTDKQLVRPGLGAVSSSYGMRRHPVTGVDKLHTGVDFRPADGRAYAAADGTVATVTVDPAYGNLVTIAHGAGITTRYAHLARPLVRPGDRVTGGEVIGRIGSTGLSTGPHLHFEVQVHGEFRDPGPWLAQ